MQTRAKTTSYLNLCDEINSAGRCGAATRPQIHDCLPAAPTNKQRAFITKKFNDIYKITPWDLQVGSFLNLVNKYNTLLLAGTGYGKPRVPELYYLLHVKQTYPIVLVLNPLDALGDNQVCHVIFKYFTLRIVILVLFVIDFIRWKRNIKWAYQQST